MDAKTLNDGLRKLYTEHWDALTQHLPKRRGYSYPLLMDACASYAFAPVKLFIVGQQAREWGGKEYGEWGRQEFDAPVDELMRLYRTYNRAENDHKRAFWEATYYDSRMLATLEHPALPKNTFRAYHPEYLKKKKKISEVVGKIAALVQAA